MVFSELFRGQWRVYLQKRFPPFLLCIFVLEQSLREILTQHTLAVKCYEFYNDHGAA